MQITSVVLAAAMSCTIASTLAAQGAEPQAASRKSSWELVVPSGTLVQTGAQRDAIKRANISAIQVMYVPRPAIAVTSTFG